MGKIKNQVFVVISGGNVTKTIHDNQTEVVVIDYDNLQGSNKCLICEDILYFSLRDGEIYCPTCGFSTFDDVEKTIEKWKERNKK